MSEFIFSSYENKITCDHLRAGETCKMIGICTSMTPILQSRQAVICTPVTESTVLEKKNIVLCKVNEHYYLHLIHAIGPDCRCLIGNNHRHMNGWTSRNQIYGKVIEIL